MQKYTGAENAMQNALQAEMNQNQLNVNIHARETYIMRKLCSSIGAVRITTRFKTDETMRDVVKLALDSIEKI